MTFTVGKRSESKSKKFCVLPPEVLTQKHDNFQADVYLLFHDSLDSFLKQNFCLESSDHLLASATGWRSNVTPGVLGAGFGAVAETTPLNRGFIGEFGARQDFSTDTPLRLTVHGSTS